jgi:hypothetical protein
MNKAVTDGLVLMPPPFAAGLSVWSSTNGTPGSATYNGAPNAAFVPADQDFGGCLEVQKTDSTQKLRWMGEVPIQPGCYWRIRARVKAISGNLPIVRIAAWAGNGSGGQLGGVVQQGAETVLTTYGEVIEVSAIVGTGAKGGVDMAWGTAAVYGHFGVDLTGANGGVVRIDDIIIEDVTSFYLGEMVSWIDVRDFGAIGDGIADDRGAFVAAVQATNGRGLFVPEGTYFIGTHLTIPVPVRFEGTLIMDGSTRLLLTRAYDFPTYEAAFGGSDLGFRKGVQALFYFTEHVTFDLKGRRVRLNTPVDVAALAGLDSFAQRRTIANGQLDAELDGTWATQTSTRTATYNANQPNILQGMTNLSTLPVGSRITGAGVGREVYISNKNVGAGTIGISQQLFDAEGTQSYTFTRNQYLLDFSGFQSLDRFEVENVEFLCRGVVSALILPTDGAIFRVNDCVFNEPKDRGITSHARGCQGLLVDHCQFLSPDMPLLAQNRTSIALNVNSNDAKLRNNRVVLFGHFAVLNGTGHLILGNHFFQGDDAAQGIRQAGIVFTRPSVASTVTGNYIDNCFIEMTNEHSVDPAWNNQFSFGGLSITGNIFICSQVASWFRWIVIKPYGPGHFLQGLQVSGNVFRTFNASIDRVDGVDTTFAALEPGLFRNVLVQNNAFNGVANAMESPITLRHDQNSAANTWSIGTAGYMPFGGWARTVSGLVMEGAFTGPANEPRSAMPYVTVQQGAGNNQVALNWPSQTRGRAVVTVRVDNPI